ncbi:hypothetical protein EK904_013839 [Melospiza melodia maxima]|nr:hypothetical protein EK904_013839 [Melospiza melodia maxima]
MLKFYSSSSVALREESDVDAHQRISDSILTIVWWPCLCTKEGSIGKPSVLKAGGCTLYLFADIRLDVLMGSDVSLACSALSRHIHSLSFPVCVPAEWVPPCRSGWQSHPGGLQGSTARQEPGMQWRHRRSEWGVKVFLPGISCSSQHEPREGHPQAQLETDKHRLLLFQVS